VIRSNSNLTIITVHKGPIDQLKKTLKSIDSQLLSCCHSIVVAKNLSKYQTINFQRKNRILIINKDKSIYNAMNIGLKQNSFKDKYLIFLNSGDQFLDKRITLKLNKYLALKMPIIGKVILKDNENFFYIKKKFFRKNYQPQMAFLMPPNLVCLPFKKIKFEEKYLIDADGIWMKKIISYAKNKIKKINETISIHALGGVSSKPTLYSCLYYFRKDFYLFLKEIIKFFLYLIFSKKKYYEIIYSIKYHKVNKKNAQ
jgi:hypothetical protein